MNSVLKANVSSMPLDIPNGVYMGGYADRKGLSKGIHDYIYSKALTVSNEDKTIIIISNDLLGIDEEIVKKVVSGINEEVNIPEEDIFICATHTHSAPDIIGWEYEKWSCSYKLNREIKEYIINAMIENALKSTEELKPVGLTFGKSKCSKVVSNRVNQDDPVDDSVNGIFLIQENDLPLCIILNYACHPTVLSAENQYISADYPGVLQRLTEEYFDNECTCMFINGACGNQSTRFTRKSQDFDEVERMGKSLFDAVLKAYNNRQMESVSLIGGVKRYVEFPKRELPSREEALKYYERMTEELNKMKSIPDVAPEELRGIITKYQGASITLELIDVLEEFDLNAPIQLMRLGDIVLTGVPVELFNDYGFLIKEKSGFTNTIIAGYTNGMLGYVYTPKSYEDGDYEAWSSPFDKYAGNFITENIIKLIEEL